MRIVSLADAKARFSVYVKASEDELIVIMRNGKPVAVILGLEHVTQLGEAEEMCRSIKQLRGAEPPASEDEVQAAALQYIRKVSGYRAPSRANQAAFDTAVAEVTAATQRLLMELNPGREKQHAQEVYRTAHTAQPGD